MKEPTQKKKKKTPMFFDFFIYFWESQFIYIYMLNLFIYSWGPMGKFKFLRTNG
jgi:hypothetical protein